MTQDAIDFLTPPLVNWPQLIEYKDRQTHEKLLLFSKFIIELIVTLMNTSRQLRNMEAIEIRKKSLTF